VKTSYADHICQKREKKGDGEGGKENGAEGRSSISRIFLKLWLSRIVSIYNKG
jgi:hypothetical protein